MKLTLSGLVFLSTHCHRAESLKLVIHIGKNRNCWAVPPRIHVKDTQSTQGFVCTLLINNGGTSSRESTLIWINFKEGHLAPKTIFYVASVSSYFRGLRAHVCLKVKESVRLWGFCNSWKLLECLRAWTVEKASPWLLGHRRISQVLWLRGAAR